MEVEWTTIYPTDNELPKFPQFIRFDKVTLGYQYSNVPIDKMCQSVVNYLQPLKSALNDSNMIYFACEIGQKRRHFTDDSKLLNYLQESLMPICNSSRGYKFEMVFFADVGAGSKITETILQMPEIVRCSTLEISFILLRGPIQLPVEAISNWLHRRYDGTNENQRELFLRFGACNIGDLYEHLKKVITIVYIQNFIRV